MRACIYGAGAMGTALGALIARSGRDIDLVTRNAEHVAALRAAGARVDFPAAGGGFVQRVRALFPQEMTGTYDVIFLMTKQRGNAEVAAFLKDKLAEGGAICTLQNGLPEYSVAAVVGEQATLGCAVSWGASYVCPGRVAVTSSPDAMSFSLGSPFGRSSMTEAVAEYLKCAGRVEIERDFLGARWSKLIVNGAFSTISALTSLTFGQIAGGLRSRRLALRMLAEGVAAASACGVVPAKIQGHDPALLFGGRRPLSRAVAFAALPFAMKKHKNLVSGMYYDLAAGRKCDMDFVAGELSRRARGAGVATPALDAALALAEQIGEGRAAVAPGNVRVLTKMLRGTRKNNN